MTHPLTTKTVYVEGDDDVHILQAWFPNIQFTSRWRQGQGGKEDGRQDPACYGLEDRDFADRRERGGRPGARQPAVRCCAAFASRTTC